MRHVLSWSGPVWVPTAMWDDPRVQSLSDAAFRVFCALSTASAHGAREVARATAAEIAERLPAFASAGAVEEALIELEGAGLITREGGLAVTCYAALPEEPV